MKNRLKIPIAFLCLSAVLITALTSWKGNGNKHQEKKEFKNRAASEELRKRMEQRAIITATVFKDRKLLQLYVHAIKEKIAANDQNDEAITFDEIAEANEKYVTEFAPAFKTAYLAVLKEGDYYRASTFGDPFGEYSGRLEKTNGSKEDELFYKNDGAQIYFPYSGDFEEANVSDVAVTYHPLEEVEENEAFRVVGEKAGEVETIKVDEAFVQDHPTLVINFDEDELAGKLDGGQGPQNPQDPVPPPIECNLLVHNTFSDVLDDRYVITVMMPKIKLLRNFHSFIGGANYITIYQCYANPGNMNINPTPTLDPITSTSRIVVHEFKIRRNKKAKWIDFNQIYNDDWRLIQYDNPMLLWVKRGWFANPTAAVDLSVGGGVKLDTIRIHIPGHPDSLSYRWLSSFNLGATAKLHIDVGPKYQYLGSDYVTRRGLLANCVGDNFGNGTALDAGEQTPWSVRRLSDAMLYYFKVRECHQ